MKRLLKKIKRTFISG